MKKIKSAADRFTTGNRFGEEKKTLLTQQTATSAGCTRPKMEMLVVAASIWSAISRGMMMILPNAFDVKPLYILVSGLFANDAKEERLHVVYMPKC
jgi:hypothetical protein